MSVLKVTQANLTEFLSANKAALVILAFDAEFSCQQDLVETAVNYLTESSELREKIVVGTVDVESNNELAVQYSVCSVPMIICFHNGKVVKKIDTFEPSKLASAIREQLSRLELVANEQVGDQQTVDPKEKFNQYLKQLTNRAPVMIFMKGEPKAPRCGFSRQLVELLAKHDIKYETFDILQDDEVRQGLKEYSEWPTYPQIYAKGEFVGGLDILKQIEESGELESTLKN